MKIRNLLVVLTLAAFAGAVSARASDNDKDKDTDKDTKGQAVQTVIVANTPVPVTVTNPSLPVTVSNNPGVTVTNNASVTVTNTPAVTVTNTPGVVVTNTPSVNIANTPAVLLAPNTQVIVGNSSSAAIPVVSLDANGAFQTDLTLGIGAGQSAFLGVSIPAGRRLVVEYVTLSGAASSLSGAIQPVVLFESSLSGGGAANFYVKPDPSSLLPGQFYHSEQVKIYADTLNLALGYAGFSPFVLVFNVAISGHLVAAP
jgi:hypothetical protein